MGKNEKNWTVENFVDVVNEVLLQCTKDDERYNEIQELLLKFLKDEITIDQFGFEFAMVVTKHQVKAE